MVQLLNQLPEREGATPPRGSGDATIKFCRRTQISPDPDQPRQNFDDQKLNELVESFRQHGFDPSLSHLLVRPAYEYRIRPNDAGHIFYIERKVPALLIDQIEKKAAGEVAEPEWQVIGTAATEEAAHTALETEREFILIVGERRWRASEIAEIGMVPYVAKDLSSPADILELQLVENLLRDDLNPLEEAQGFKRLNGMGRTLAQIAAKFGLTERVVQDRILLCRLIGSEVADALEKGVISGTHGLILAQVPGAATRLELLEKVLAPPDGSSAPWSTAKLRQCIGLDYMIDLRTAKFEKEDPDLVPAEVDQSSGERLWGGACGDCPFNVNTGTKVYVPMCTHPECFRMKEVATHERWQAEVLAEGKTALSAAENATLWDESGIILAHHSPYVELSQPPALDELAAEERNKGLAATASWRKLIKGQGVPIVCGRDTAGRVHELALHDLAKKAAHQNEHLIFRDSAKETRTDKEKSATSDRASSAPTDEEHKEETLEEKRARELKTAISTAEVAAIVEAAEGKVRRRMLQIPKPFWSVAAASLLDTVNQAGALEKVTGRREYELDEGSFAKLSLGELFGLVVECMVLLSDNPEAWANVFEVKLAKVRKAAAKAAK